MPTDQSDQLSWKMTSPLLKDVMELRAQIGESESTDQQTSLNLSDDVYKTDLSV